MPSFTPKMFVICLALAIGPPAAILALNYKAWLVPKPIDPHVATGQVLFFGADWCPACRAMRPVAQQLEQEGFDIRELNVDTHHEEAAKYDIHLIPAFILVRDGQEVRRDAGVLSPETLRQLWR
jgi:thioredoxin 1